MVTNIGQLQAQLHLLLHLKISTAVLLGVVIGDNSSLQRDRARWFLPQLALSILLLSVAG